MAKTASKISRWLGLLPIIAACSSSTNGSSNDNGNGGKNSSATGGVNAKGGTMSIGGTPAKGGTNAGAATGGTNAGGTNAGSTNAGAAAGGTNAGGTAAGTTAAGGTANGGASSGGTPIGGSNNAGTANGGAAAGAAPLGSSLNGGALAGGAPSGGAASGGVAVGGMVNGGAPAGAAAGRTASGGTAAGGITGGTSSNAGNAGASRGGSAGSDAGAAGSATRQATCPVPAGAEMPEASLPPGYCSWIFAQALTSPRGMITDSQGQLLVVEAGTAGAITLLWDDNGDRVNQTGERLRIATTAGLNHGIALNGGYLYASTETTVYRWPYDGSHAVLANRQTVLSGIPSGGHSTRTLVFDRSGNLYISIGSGSNLDADSSRARVVRLDAAHVTAGNAVLADVTVHADGTRNEVGLRFDSRGRLWGVENGSDDLQRADLGGDIHNDNPAEELNLFNNPGAFYGYPYCWSEGNLATGIGLGRGTQWAYPSVMADGTHTDAWCRSATNVFGPIYTMQAHSAPLDVLFYQGGSFPDDVVGDAIITFHGSWDRTTATGYKVIVVPFGADGMPNGEATPLLESVAAGDTGGGWTHRPVGLTMGRRGEVYVTSDTDGLVMGIGHN
jgi:glucose/arabinose dehydrogenase